jgi:ferritin-like protein
MAGIGSWSDNEEINVEVLIKLLNQNAARELTIFYYYTILLAALEDLEDSVEVMEVVEAFCAEDRKHFETMVGRIYQLGGNLPPVLTELESDASELPLNTPSRNMQSAEGLIRCLVEIQRRAVRGYTRLCDLTAGRDHSLYLMALDILNEELEHVAWLSQFLNETEGRHGKSEMEHFVFYPN